MTIPFVAIPTWIIKKRAQEPGWLSCSELSVLIALQYFASGTSPGQTVYPSYKSICAHANVSKRTASECINGLVEKGLIGRTARRDSSGQTSNLYSLKYWGNYAKLETEPASRQPTFKDIERIIGYDSETIEEHETGVELKDQIPEQTKIEVTPDQTIRIEIVVKVEQ